jgi:hypothetical protein
MTTAGSHVPSDEELISPADRDFDPILRANARLVDGLTPFRHHTFQAQLCTFPKDESTIHTGKRLLK